MKPINWNKIFIYGGILLAMLFWSLSYVLTKIVYTIYLPLTTVLIRLIIGSAFLFLLAKLLGKLEKIRPGDTKMFIMLSLLQPFLYFLCESFGLKYVSSTLASAIITTIPLFTPFVAVYFLKEKLSLFNVVGLIVSFTGVLLMTIKNDFSISASPLGLLLLFMAVASGVTYTTYMKKITTQYNPLTIVTYQNLLGILWFLPLFLIFEWGDFSKTVPTMGPMISLLLLALLPTSLAFVFYSHAIKHLGAARTSMFANIMPAMTAIFAWLLLGEHLTMRMTIAIAVVVAGLFIAQSKGLNKNKP